MLHRLSRLCTHTHSHKETPAGLLWLGRPPRIHHPQPLPLPSPRAPRTNQSGTGDLWRPSLAQDPQLSAHQEWCPALGKLDSRGSWGEGPTGACLEPALAGEGSCSNATALLGTVSHHKTHPLKVQVMIFSEKTELCNHHHNPASRHLSGRELQRN